MMSRTGIHAVSTFLSVLSLYHNGILRALHLEAHYSKLKRNLTSSTHSKSEPELASGYLIISQRSDSSVPAYQTLLCVSKILLPSLAVTSHAVRASLGLRSQVRISARLGPVTPGQRYANASGTKLQGANCQHVNAHSGAQ